MTAARGRLPHAAMLLVLAAAELMLTLDLSIVNVALPAMREDLAFGAGSLEWVINGYALAFGGFLLLGGRAADLFGGRRVFLGALGAFTLASLACALAVGPATLVTARVVQGLSAGVLSPATLSILTTAYRSPDERNRALSIWTAVAIGGGAVGALLGGLLTAELSWRWIFVVNAPVGAALMAMGAARIPRARGDRGRQRLDLAGAVTVTAGLSTLVWALVHTDRAGWGSPDVVAALAAAALLLCAFALVETRLARAPLVPFSVFRSRLLSVGNLLSFLSFVPVMATWFFLTLYLQQVRGHGAIATGVLFLPMSVAVVAGSQAGFRVISGVDARALFAVGGLLAAAGLTWLGRMSATTGIAWVIAPGSLAMVGGGLMFAPITVAATAGVTAQQSGLAGGLLNTTRQIGGALGLAVLGTMVSGDQPAAGYAHALTVGAGVFVITALLGACALPARLTPSAADRLQGRRRAAWERMRHSSGLAIVDAHDDFTRARRSRLAARTMRSIGIRRCCRDVPPTLPDRARRTGQVRGRRVIPLEAIVGTVEPSPHFDERFRPTSWHLRARWEHVALAYRQGLALPPITVREGPDGFYVLDGRHRVSVARAMGQREIEAWVM